MVIFDPLKRVEEIETCLFNAIVCTYANGTVDYNFAKEKLYKYREKGYELIEKLSDDEKIKHTEQLYYSFYNNLEYLNQFYDNLEHLRKKENDVCPYLDGICEKCPC